MQSTDSTDKPDWDDVLPVYKDYLESGSLSPATIKLRLYHLGRIREALNTPLQDVTLDDLTAYYRGRDWSPNTRAVVRASMSVFFKFAHGTGRIPTNPALELPTVRVPHGKPKPASDEAVNAALGSAPPMVRLMVTIGVRAGLRVMEVAGLHTDHVVQDQAGYSLRIKGKGSKVRMVPIQNDLAELLLDRPRGYIFPGKIDGHISPAYVSRLVSKVLPEGVTAHKLRHRFATRAYRGSGHNLRAVQELLGHASIETTTVYTGLDNDELRQAALSAE